ELQNIDGHDASDGPRARFQFFLHPPPGAANRSLQLRDAIVAHEVVTHYIRVYVRSDWASGFVTGSPRLAGTIHAGRHEVTVDRAGSLWRGLHGLVALGSAHIATGTDHLLFLFALVLVAPLTAAAGWYCEVSQPRTAWLALLRVVTAFTLGHSLTLVLGATRVIVLPTAWVEPAIAASIFVTALHAIWPLFPRREAWVASLFGLVHGLAFADALADHQLDATQAAWSLLGFNIGIELAQVAILLLVAPWLMLLARTRKYAAFRCLSAALMALLALAWLLERTLGVANPTAQPLAFLEAHPLALLITLAAAALVARFGERHAAR
ncbi:MAG: HupE/UreJ family protein, partial [Polyangiales bacterium]